MSVHKLLDPILDQGLLHTNFFEGRLLSARDLRDQQDAYREHGRRLGRALGSGIIDGLEVVLERDGSDGQLPVVTVRAGLAINADGEIIGLPKHDVQVALARSITATPTTEADFYACVGPPNTRSLPSGVGVYVLVMSPAAGYKDRAPLSGLGDPGIVKGCGSRYVQEGVRFRLVDLNPADSGGISAATRALVRDDLLGPNSPAMRSEPARISRLRNLLAHMCFGAEAPAGFAADPFAREGGRSPHTRYGAIDELRQSGVIVGGDVPLALLYWTLDGIGFVDLWAVRRRPGPGWLSADWPLLSSVRTWIEGEARLFQFQDQLRELIAVEASPATISAQSHFCFLPPAGLLPLVDPGRARGVTVPGFFGARTRRDPVFIEGARLQAVMAAARHYPAINLAQMEMMWVYLLRENRQPVAPGATPPPAAAVFVSAHLPFQGDARFDVNRWNYSNFGSLRVR